MDKAAVEPAATKLDAFRVQLLYQRLDGVPASRKPLKNVGDDGPCIGIGYDRSLAVCAVDIPIPDRRETRVNPRTSLLQHALPGFLAQVEYIVAGHQHI